MHVLSVSLTQNSLFNNSETLLYKSASLSYNITGESAPIFFQSKKCRQKHGGFQHLLTPYGSSGSGYSTTDQPRSYD